MQLSSSKSSLKSCPLLPVNGSNALGLGVQDLLFGLQLEFAGLRQDSNCFGVADAHSVVQISFRNLCLEQSLGAFMVSPLKRLAVSSTPDHFSYDGMLSFGSIVLRVVIAGLLLRNLL